MKTAFLIPYLEGGGAERATVTIASLLNREFFEPVIITQIGGEPKYVPGDHVRVLSLGKDRWWKGLPALVRILGRERPDILYSALHHMNLLAWVALRIVAGETKLVLSVHNNPSFDVAHLRKPLRWLLRFAYGGADAVVAVSGGVGRAIGRYGASPERTFVLWNPIPIDEIRSLSREKIEHPWFHGTYAVVVTVGRLTAQKGLQLLIRAFGKVLRHIPHARLVVLGEGPERPRLEMLSMEEGLDKAIRFEGFQGNPFAYLSQASCFVLPSLWEGFGMSIVEAMAVGTPVIATRCPYGPEEIINHGINGLLVRPGDAEELANMIVEVLTNDRLRGRLVAGGLVRARDFDAPLVTRHYESLFLRLVSR